MRTLTSFLALFLGLALFGCGSDQPLPAYPQQMDDTTAGGDLSAFEDESDVADEGAGEPVPSPEPAAAAEPDIVE